MGDEADYVAKQNQSEDVKLLSNQVNERLRQAIESDTVLAGIYKDLGTEQWSIPPRKRPRQETKHGLSWRRKAARPRKTEVLSRPRTRSADAGQNSQGEGIQNVPAGQEGTNARESEGTPAAAQENQGTDSGTAGGSGTEESAGTAGGSSVKIE